MEILSFFFFFHIEPLFTYENCFLREVLTAIGRPSGFNACLIRGTCNNNNRDPARETRIVYNSNLFYLICQLINLTFLKHSSRATSRNKLFTKERETTSVALPQWLYRGTDQSFQIKVCVRFHKCSIIAQNDMCVCVYTRTRLCMIAYDYRNLNICFTQCPETLAKHVPRIFFSRKN